MEVKMTNKKNSDIRKRTHEKVDKIINKAESMKKIGNKKIVNLEEKAIVMKKNVEGYIRKNSKKSVLIATGIGAVVGATLATAVIKRKH